MTLAVAQADPEEVPPWHPWCGCYGCRAGNNIGKKAIPPKEVDA